MWELSAHPANPLVLSASADASIKSWNYTKVCVRARALCWCDSLCMYVVVCCVGLNAYPANPLVLSASADASIKLELYQGMRACTCM